MTKTVNYTTEMTAEVVEGYKAGKTVEALAAATGKSVRSIVAKLSNEGVYVKADKASGVSETITKEDYIKVIAEATGVDFDVLASLGKATKAALKVVADKLAFAD